MPIASIRRRVGRLEGSGVFMSVGEYPPLTSPEIEAIAYRLRDGMPLTREEMDRLQRYSPIMDGEILMSAHHGHVSVKRYIGVDVSEI